MQKMIFWICLCAALCASCSSNRPLKTEVYLEGDSLYYKGDIRAKYFNQLKSLYAKAATKPRRLIVTSGGGSLSVGRAFGNWLVDQQLDVQVHQFCLSSCANYIFTAGKRKFLERDAVLAWHGGALQQNMQEQIASLLRGRDPDKASYQGRVTKSGDKNYPLCKAILSPRKTRTIQATSGQCIAELQQLELAFYQRIHTDPQLSVYGQQGNCETNYHSKAFLGFYYDLDDLDRLGVKAIELIDGSWQPETNPRFGELKIYRVSLNTSASLQSKKQTSSCAISPLPPAWPLAAEAPAAQTSITPQPIAGVSAQ